MFGIVNKITKTQSTFKYRSAFLFADCRAIARNDRDYELKRAKLIALFLPYKIPKPVKIK